MIILCKNCEAEIEQLETGSWIRMLSGIAFCGRQFIDQRVLHEPVIHPEWIQSIKHLNSSNPSFWTAKELAKLMRLSVPQIEEVLE
jgi:hypothetical protein